MRKLTVSDYSNEIGKSKQSIYNRIKRGTLKSENVDGVSYVYVEDVETTVEQPHQPLNQPLIKELKQHTKNVKQSENRNEIINLKSQLKEYKKLYKESRDIIKEKDKEIKRLNKKLHGEKDNSIDILKQFIGEMKVLSHRNEVVETEIIDDDIDTKKKKKKKSKNKGKK